MSLNYSIWKLNKNEGVKLRIKDLDFMQMIEHDKDIANGSAFNVARISVDYYWY